MTTAQLEHLRAIDAHLARLLDIASCAGNAEAGWNATRIAIKSLLEYTGHLTPMIEREYAEEKLTEILTTFPLELIMP